MSKQTQSPIEGSVLEGISKVLGDTANGLSEIEIGKFLQEVSISDVDSSNTKWKRLYNAFVTFQNRRQLSNNILKNCNGLISKEPAIRLLCIYSTVRYEYFA